MNRRSILIRSAAALVFAAFGIAGQSPAVAAGGLTLAVTMTNNASANRIQVYDVESQSLLQTLDTGGAGGAGGNARGVRQFDGVLFAAVNNGSNTVSIFRRAGNALQPAGIVATTGAPLSIDFGNGHMYVANATTVDSFPVHGYAVGGRDGTATLQLAEGGAPPAGATSQVGVVDETSVLVTLKSDPSPGTVDVVALDANGAITGSVTPVAGPDPSSAPFGFVVYPDGTAVITLAHTNENGLFRDGAFVAHVASGVTANCWAARLGKYTFTANTGSRTISRLVGTGHHVFSDAITAATITTGGPSDIDADGTTLGVIDRGGGASRLTLFDVNEYGELTQKAGAIALGVPGANGVAILSPR
jgi:hypothetical protein